MGYRVIKYFTDLKDHNHEYQVGDKFPHEGLEVSEERYKELSSTANRRGIPLIEKIEETEEIEEVEETEKINDEPVVEESKETPTKEKKPTTSTTKKASSASKEKKERTKKNAE